WLGEAAGLDDVERRMRTLALEAGGPVAGPMAVEQLATGGKRVRARLALAAAAARGAPGDAAVAWAAAVELLHNATLVHDDIEDGDRMRRGRPTLWAVHGLAQAINAGDLLLMLPFAALRELPAAVRGELASRIAARAVRTVGGQASELELLASQRLDWASYHDAVAGKTGALLALPVEGAVLLAGRTPAETERLAAPFVELGVLFQLQDDVLDLYGDKGRAEVGSDLYEGKVSALVVEHLARHPAERAALCRLLAAPRDATPAADVAATLAAFRHGGALEAVLGRIDALGAAIFDSAPLRREPALHAVAKELVELATAPIRHVACERKERVA
ncbi:MAG: polyprenyl synthetase family protein, partial [Polyangiaceae bacterium]|nr:polyprenyl synthetase family protein [Polyangiaceae bacterium]